MDEILDTIWVQSVDVSPQETEAGFVTSGPDHTRADLDEARTWAGIAIKRAILRDDPHAAAAARAYLERLERMARR